MTLVDSPKRTAEMTVGAFMLRESRTMISVLWLRGTPLRKSPWRETSVSKMKQGPEGMALPPPPVTRSGGKDTQGHSGPAEESTDRSGSLEPVLQKLEPKPSGGDSPPIILASKDRGSLRQDNWLATKSRCTNKLWV